MTYFVLIGSLLWALGSPVPQASAEAMEVPALMGRIVDVARLLPPDVAASLADELAEHERRTGNQVVVLTVPSLQGESLEAFSHRVASRWQLGRQGIDNGVLLLVVPGDRRMRIEVGYGLEGTLTDAMSARIIRHEIVPRFRAGDYPGGIAAGVRAILQTIEGTYVASPSENPEEAGEALPALFLMAVLLGALIGGPLLGGQLKLLGSLFSGVLSFIIALPGGLLLALVAAVCGLVAALVLSVLASSAGPARGWGGRRWPGGVIDSGWRWSAGRGGFSSHETFWGGGGGFGGGGASGRW